MRVIFFLLILIHALIHLIGFAKAFKLAEVSQLSHEISKVAGLLWLSGAILLATGAVLFLFRNPSWWLPAGAGMILSQVLVILLWSDAKFGTVANLIMIIPVIIAGVNALPSSFASIYKEEVRKGLSTSSAIAMVTEDDLKDLPLCVQKYLRYTGAVGKPQIANFRARCTGQIRLKKDGNWMDFTSEQHNFFRDPARLFLIESTMYGIPFDGLHKFVGSNATMQIRVASLFQVVDARGPLMTKGETVTLFNDLCVMAPSRLVDKTIAWQTIDSLTAKAKFTNKGVTISALLYFNERGELINFVSDDRYESSDGITYNNYRWTTPVKSYGEFGVRKAATYGEAIWTTPEGNFTYGKFNILEIEYNRKLGDGI
jgi:hypothetical protein